MAIKHATLRGGSNLQGLKLNLQFFSDSGAAETQTAETEDQETRDTEVKTYTQEELDALLQQESDKRVTSAIKKKQSEWEEQFKTKLEAEKQEAKKLAKLSESERAKALLDKQQMEFEAERLSFQREKIELEVTKQLAEKELPIRFAKLLVTDDAETSLENINTFEKDWQDALKKAVDEKLKGSSPKGGGTSPEVGGIGQRLAEARKQTQVSSKENPYF